MRLGDSATFILPAKAYFETYNYGNVPAFVKKKTMLYLTVCLHNIQTFEEYKAQQMQESLAKEKELIQAYLESKNLQAEPTASGLYYIETKAGKGKHPVKGMSCTVHYRGMLLDGTVFDASYNRNKPFTFELGMGQVIAGWDEGIALMKKGGKATLVLPSAIAYGERGAGDIIPPFSPLVFEVELLDFH
ncbi:MAG: FKBP-type peptidyl-prolyl cis-trans isomerase [Bacteroidales bacterium]|nr:FKBP-type peptidyl-prolyl cis-trans isomerase [Bacteroidales bacterium]